ncbi:calmodulin-binding transcription activator 2 isoform X2 [Brienomyrus brachyistius]|uniref:calmodulin-binding transcription activator 2 isoform X2 n=1 Tax=Brienomyrus brachyistius TaxID=42636 RepID=UPI0020B31E33|nr:calmodulin-binding transcription activator 2 isoform X2 [Brienomyrus brachyistius]
MNNKESPTERDERASRRPDSKSQMKVFLPKKLLECLPCSSVLPKERLQWNTNEEIASYLISFDRHEEWLSCTLKARPINGSMILYNRKKVKYRKDGYCWKKRKDGKTTREDHMKLKVHGIECLYGCYVHSSVVPTFHRRCYWLLQNPDIVLVHYLNVLSLEDCGTTLPCSPADWRDSPRWTQQELLSQLKPMFHSVRWPCSDRSRPSEVSVERLAQSILNSQQTKPKPRTHACLCSPATAGANIPHCCNGTKHRIISPKLPARPATHPGPTDVQNLGSGGSPESGGKRGASRGIEEGIKRSTPAPQVGGVRSLPAKVGLTASPPMPRTAASLNLGRNHGSGVSSNHGDLAAVGVPQSAVIVMTTIRSRDDPKGEPAFRGPGGVPSKLPLTSSAHLLLPSNSPPREVASPSLTSSKSSASSPVNRLPVPVGGAGAPGWPPPSQSISPTPGVATLSLTLLPSPVIRGLVLSNRLISGSDSPGSALPPPTSSPSHSCPPQKFPPPPAAPPLPPPTPLLFDPDSFLNSPQRGQTYGGPSQAVGLSLPLSQPMNTSCSSDSLSPSSSVSSLSPSSALSSLSSETESRRNSPPGPCSRATPSGSSPLSASLALPLSPSTPSLLPLCLDSALGLDTLDVLASSDIEGDDHQQGTLPAIRPPLSLKSMGLPCLRPPSGLIPSPVIGQLPSLDPDSAFLRPALTWHAEGTPQHLWLRRILSGNSVQDRQHSPWQPQLSRAPEPSLAHSSPSPASLQSECHVLEESRKGRASPSPCAPVKGKHSSSSSSSPSLDRHKAEETLMDTTSCVESSDTHALEGQDVLAALTVLEGCNTELPFNSHFPDLISPLVGADRLHDGEPDRAGPVYSCPPPPRPAVSLLPLHSRVSPGAEARCLSTITDFSPEWSYPEGGVKVLITGPWTETTGRYSCVFDQSAVPASLIQPGVLRCYCPTHEAGLVTLHVLQDRDMLSSSVLFEYRARSVSSQPSSQPDWLSLDDNQFRMSILERLEQMEKRMAEMTTAGCRQQTQGGPQGGSQRNPMPPDPGERTGAATGVGEQTRAQSGSCFEQRIVGVCERMMAGGRRGGGSEKLLHSVRHRGMTLLHLAAAQGYTQLIHTLIHWRSVNSDSLHLEQEVDPLNVDHFSCTPLMWACALGHQGAAVLLYRWNSLALGIADSLGRLPLAVARSRGHTRLASCLEELHSQVRETADPAQEPGPNWNHTNTQAQLPLPALPPSPLSTSPDTGLSSSSSLASPSDPPSLSPSSAYSSGSVPQSSPLHNSPDPMDTLDASQPTPSSPATPLAPPMWGDAYEASRARESAPPMEYELARTPSPPANPQNSRHSRFEAELLSYSENAENEDYVENLQVDMAMLAEQIIEATPERIKQEEAPRGAESPLRERRDNPAIHDTLPWLATYLDTVDNMPVPPRCVCCKAPVSRPPQPPSPLGSLALQHLRPLSSATWAEFLNASSSGRMEHEFALLTLSDGEQRELYEAARVIQTAFHRYKGRRLKEQQDRAAAVIQRCYRKYKQYALYKKMTQAAILIQSKFRSYYEQKKFQQSRRAAVLIQQYYRSYKGYEQLKQGSRGPGALNPKIKGSFLTKKQDQAARKIMRFLRRCRHRIKELKQSKELERMQKRGLTT